MEHHNKTVYDMADEVFRPVSFIDHEGTYRTFRRFSIVGSEGVTDIYANDLILPARYPCVEISSHFEAFIAGGLGDFKERRMVRFARSLQKIAESVEKGCFKFLSPIFNNIASNILGDTDKTWVAFSIDGKPLFNGENFFYSDILKMLEERAKEWETWAPDLEECPMGHDWRSIVRNTQHS